MSDPKQTLHFYVDEDRRYIQNVKLRDFNFRNYPTLNALLDTLTPRVDNLNYGVRLITTAGGQTKIERVEDFKPFKSYVNFFIVFPFQ
jgi:hypothetical protein